MKPANRKFLEDNRHHHDTLIRAFYLRHLDAPTREGLMRVMAEEFQPGYTADIWCPVCVSDMVKMVYRVYDDWLARQPVIEIVDEFSRRKAQLIEDWFKRDPKVIPVLTGEPEFIDLSAEATEPKAEMLEGLIKIPRIDVVSEFGHGNQAATENIVITHEEQKPVDPPAAVQIKATFPKHHNPNRRR